MPELPEVEFARRGLARWLVGRRIAAVRVEDPAVVRRRLSTQPRDARTEGVEWAEGLVGARVLEPLRHGKRLGLRFAGPDRAALAHLGMTGKWVRRPAGDVPRFARLGLSVGDAVVWFTDARRFGCVAPVEDGDLDAALRDGLGPDALRDAPAAALLRDRLGGRRPIKVALLDQARLAGIGNLHAAEALWRARIPPATAGHALRDADWERLAEAIAAQMAEALAVEDDEITYVEEGGPNPFAVYDRAGRPCPRCGAAVASFPQAGRTTFWCPGCQAPPGRDSRRGRSPRHRSGA